jgi:glyoxylate reductase
VSVYSAGVDNVDIAAATRNGVMVANTPDVLTDATADVAILLMLASARRAVEADRCVRAGQFAGWSSEFMLGLDVSGRTLGLAGFGRIARATARRALGFDMRVLYCPRPPGDAPSSNPDLGTLAGRVERRSWPELIAESDFLSLHVPLADDTHHLVDGDTLKAMKSSAVLVNTARGPIVDEGALVQALRSGEIAAAGLDVYEHEPAVADGLLALANTVLLPHIGSATVSVRAEMARLCAQNAVELAAGRQPLAAVNPEAWRA